MRATVTATGYLYIWKHKDKKKTFTRGEGGKKINKLTNQKNWKKRIEKTLKYKIHPEKKIASGKCPTPVPFIFYLQFIIIAVKVPKPLTP